MIKNKGAPRFEGLYKKAGEQRLREEIAGLRLEFAAYLCLYVARASRRPCQSLKVVLDLLPTLRAEAGLVDGTREQNCMRPDFWNSLREILNANPEPSVPAHDVIGRWLDALAHDLATRLVWPLSWCLSPAEWHVRDDYASLLHDLHEARTAQYLLYELRVAEAALRQGAPLSSIDLAPCIAEAWRKGIHHSKSGRASATGGKKAGEKRKGQRKVPDATLRAAWKEEERRLPGRTKRTYDEAVARKHPVSPRTVERARSKKAGPAG